MSEAAPGLYTGLDQLIAKPTKAEPAPVPTKVEAPEMQHELSTPLGGDGKAGNHERTSEQSAMDANLVRQLEPDPPDAPDLYRKQTINFGPEDLEAVRKMQETLHDLHKQEISKQDIVRAAVEFLLKDHELHKENSFLVRKFVRR